MPDPDTGHRHRLSFAEAAGILQLNEDAVRKLVDAGFLAADGESLARVDVKAFLARNSDNGAGDLIHTLQSEMAEPQELLDALDGRSDEMARRAYEIFAGAFPEALAWSDSTRERFIDQSRARFEAILAVTSQGAELDEALVGDLQDVGAAAAWEGAPLPELVVVLRISRDLVMQTAVGLAEERGRHWGLALSLVLTRVLPAMDRLTDALAQGYWAAILGREEEARARYQHVVENSTDGVYEVDLDGLIQYANPALAVILGRPLGEVFGARLSDVVVPLDPNASIASLLRETSTPERTELSIARPDGVRRVIEVLSVTRSVETELVGFQGIVRDVTAARDLEAEKNEFLALVAFDLRNPLTTVLGLGATLESHADEMPVDRIAHIGASVRRNAERISRLADDLYDISRLEANALLLNPRAVPLARVVDDALQTVHEHDSVEVEIDSSLEVTADLRRLEQVVANLVENALEHGRVPVTVSASAAGENVELIVADDGDGVPAALVPALFSRLGALGRSNRERSRGTGLGLPLVQGLVEAMGGRVWYTPGSPRGARFHVVLPAVRRRP